MPHAPSSCRTPLASPHILYPATQLSIHEPEADATPEQLLRVHTPAHLARLDDAFGRVGGFLTPRVNLDADTVVSPGTQAAARRAAGLVVAAVDEVSQYYTSCCY